MNILIKNAIVVTANDVFQADIEIKDFYIKKIGVSLTTDTKEPTLIIDANRKYIFPGIIDVHTHMQLPVLDTFSCDDFFIGTKAASFGGVTTIIDFAFPDLQGNNIIKAVRKRKALADRLVCIDYSLHLGLFPADIRKSNFKKEIEKAISSGITSFKIFMAYPNKDAVLEDGLLVETMKTVRDTGGILCIHAENYSLVEWFQKKSVLKNKLSVTHYPESRPDFTESEAIRRAIFFAKITDAPIYIMHVSTGEGLDAIEEGKRYNVKVYAETCPQYLLLSKEYLRRKDGYLYTCIPPLRSKENQEMLWKGVKEGFIDVIATDHCPFTSSQKKKNAKDFRKIPFGLSGVETLLPLIYSEGVLKRGLSLNRLITLLSTNPAKIFGLYPKKGTICVGSDADLVIFDPTKKWKITSKLLHSNSDYTPYEGWEVTGYVETVISRGKIVCDNGNFLGQAGQGHFLKRKTYKNSE